MKENSATDVCPDTVDVGFDSDDVEVRLIKRKVVVVPGNMRIASAEESRVMYDEDSVHRRVIRWEDRIAYIVLNFR